MSTAEDVGRDGRDAVASLASQVSEGLRRVSAYSVLFNQAIAERLGINATDLRCLDIISRAGPLTAGRLAELTSLTTGAITGVIDRLEQAGFADRKPDPTDRRRVIVGVVPGAMKRVGPLFAPLGEAMIEFFSRYSAEELATIVDFVTGLEPIMRKETANMRADMQEVRSHTRSEDDAP